MKLFKAPFVAKLALGWALPLLMAASAYGQSSQPTNNPNQLTATRLPSAVVPTYYRLFFDPDLTEGCFTGQETIALTVKLPVREIVLNSLNLTISEAVLSTTGSTPKISVKPSIKILPTLEQISFSLENDLAPGSYKLALNFKGKFNEQLRGFYKTAVKNSTGKSIWLAATQLEPTDARSMFPCFDEPVYKAPFEVSTLIDDDQTALSNSPIEDITDRPGLHKKLVHFAATAPMSTYLVALCVGPFVGSNQVLVGGIPVRVWTVGDKQKLTRYALEITTKILPFLTEYFQEPYPGKKLDLIALPDFEAGAMENLGAVTFRESGLLFDEESDPVRTKFNIASTIAHELSHMWFGDLVTMRWWDDLWLNEAFATWMSMKTIHNLLPEWRIWEQFSLWKDRAMETDALKSSHPIHTNVQNPAQAFEMFDEITYEKGAAILQMLEAYVGEISLQKGVRSYIKDHRYGNCGTLDLWNSIGAATGKPVAKLMHPWVFQPGFPLVSVALNPGVSWTFKQQRFLLNRDLPSDKTIWSIPINLRRLTKEKKKTDHLLLVKSEESRQSFPKNSDLIVNAGNSGYFRTLYSKPLLTRLQARASKDLLAIEKLALLEDQWSLAYSGYIGIGEYLSAAQRYADEEDPIALRTLVSQLFDLNLLIEDSCRPRYAAFVRRILANASHRLSWQASAQDSDLTKLARSSILRALGTIGAEAEIINQARLYFKQYLQKADSVDKDLIESIEAIVAYNGDATTYTQLKNCWQQASLPEAEERALLSLSSFREPALIQATLSLSLEKEVKVQDGPLLLEHVLATAAGRHLALEFLTANWDEIAKRYPPNLLIAVINASASISSRSEAQKLNSFFAKAAVPAGKMAITRTLECVNNNVAFVERSKGDLNLWLTTNTYLESEISPK